ncbi:MAG: TonB-dependent receptor [Acidobacteria bacterium]|nr:TonB-dependent receptor [Acidobacteriota bacterium]MBU1473728.1 TonB-dependent receptor [Acidobacteriota bacterium]
MKKICSLMVFVALVVFPGRGEDTEQKDRQTSLQHQITVTANRIETPERETASSVTVITRQELEAFKNQTVLEALEHVMGISFTQNGPPGSAASLFIRGANPEHTKVMMDGVELNDPITPGRTFDFGLLRIENIDRIEILRGPQSTLYGSDAMGGVVNIITRKGRGNPVFEVSSEAGSYGARGVNAQISGEKAIWDYAVGVSLFENDGVSAAGSAYEGNEEKDGNRNRSFSWKFGLNPDKRLSFDFTVRSIHSRLEIDSFGGPYGDDPNNVQNYRTFLIKGGVRALLLNNRWEQTLNLSMVDYDRTQDNPADTLHLFDSEKGEYQSRLSKIDWQNNLYLNGAQTLTFGVEGIQERGESIYESDGMFGPYASLFPLQKASTFGIYAQDSLRFGGRFFAAVGARLDVHNRFGSVLTYRIAPAYLIPSTGTKFRVSFGTGFKAPSLYQLYAPGTLYGPIGNESLVPEKSIGWEAGLDQSFFDERLVIGAGYFHNRFKELILYDSFRGYYNVGASFSRGVEAAVTARPGEAFFLQASYTRTEARDLDTDSDLLRRPKNRFSAKMSGRVLTIAHLALSFVHVGSRKDLFYVGWTPTAVTMPPFSLMNAALTLDVLPHLEIFIRLDNLFDQKYEYVKGYGTFGFAAYGGFRLKIGSNP